MPAAARAVRVPSLLGMDDDPAPAPAPALRASDADRERTADALRHAAGEGRFTIDELDEWLHSTYAARTRGELAGLTADVVVPGARPQPASTTTRRLPVRPGEGGARWLVAIMGGTERKGHWRVASRATLVNFMGGSDLDLNDAELSAQRTELSVYSIMGGSEIRVPEGLNVEVSEFALMGGNGVDVGAARPDPGGPTLHVRLISIMGGTDMKRGRRLTRAERRRAKELDRARQDR